MAEDGATVSVRIEIAALRRCGAALGGELAGKARPLFQVGETLAGHLDAGWEELAEQLSRGHVFPLEGWEPGRFRGLDHLVEAEG